MLDLDIHTRAIRHVVELPQDRPGEFEVFFRGNRVEVLDRVLAFDEDR